MTSSQQTVVVCVAFGGDSEEDESICFTTENHYLVQEVEKRSLYLNREPLYQSFFDALSLLHDHTPLEASKGVLLEDDESEDDDDDIQVRELERLLKCVTSVSVARGYSNASKRVVVCYVYLD